MASAHGHLKAVEQLLRANANVDARSNRGATALYQAAASGHLEIVNALLSVNADYATEIDLGISALQRASISGHVSNRKATVKHGPC